MSAAKLVFTHPSPPESVKRLSQSSSAVLGFIVGSYLASLIDAQFHSKHRGKLVVTAIVRSFVSALVAFFIALIGWDGGNGYVGMALLFVVGWLSFESVLSPRLTHNVSTAGEQHGHDGRQRISTGQHALRYDSRLHIDAGLNLQ